MAAFNGCKGTVKYGSSPTELLGVSRWSMSETVKNNDYADNTTGCATKTNMGAKTTSITIDVNAQDGVDKGKPPLRAGDEVEIELHIDDTGANYFSGTAAVLGLNDYTVDIMNQELVTYSYDLKVQGLLVGNGTLESAS